MTSSYEQIVQQAIDLLSQLSVKDYQVQLKPHFSSSIGAHIRHIIDHFIALQTGWESGHIDYNKRHRNGDMEKSPKIAISRLQEIIEWLQELHTDDLQSELSVTCEIDVCSSKYASSKSSLERELIFVTSHAIHHYALIKIICAMQNKTIPEFFGFAPATITHLNRTA